MFFSAAKVFWLICQPSNFAALCGLIGLMLVWRWRRFGITFLTLSTAMVVIFGVLPVNQYLLSPLEDRFPRPDPASLREVAGIIILGGTERPSLSQARQLPALGFDAGRMAAAAAITRQIPDKPVIYTGGITSSEGYSQADVAAAYLKSVGVDERRLQLERRSRNTAENATMTYDMLTPAARQGSWLLITSAFHMPRAVGAFRRAGFHVVPYPVAYQTAGKNISAWTFEVAENLRLSDLAVHEWIGLLAYYATGQSEALFPAP
jgi:uncharacterized SAM-binding protein YcdF (DUF218 family)